MITKQRLKKLEENFERLRPHSNRSFTVKSERDDSGGLVRKLEIEEGKSKEYENMQTLISENQITEDDLLIHYRVCKDKEDVEFFNNLPEVPRLKIDYRVPNDKITEITINTPPN